MVEAIQKKYHALRAELDERTRRLWAASEAMVLGHGGVAAVAKATGLAESTIRCGRRELGQAQLPAARRLVARRVRQPGGGRKAVMEQDPALVTAVERLVEPTTRGDPMSPLRWTCKSTRKLAEELTGQGHPVSHTTVAQVLGF